MPKVLIADDSSVVRSQLTRWFQAEPEFGAVVAAEDGEAAVTQFQRVRPALVVLDVEMPKLSGIQALEQIRLLDKRVPVVMFSTLTSAGSRQTVLALLAGASDYTAKPGGDVSLEQARESLITKAKTLLRHSTRVLSPPACVAPPLAPRGVEQRFRAPGPQAPARARGAGGWLIVVASSTGGPVALGEFLAGLGPVPPAPVLVVQHMPAMFLEILAQRLDAKSPLNVRVATGQEEISPGDVWLAPAGSHLEVRRFEQGAVLALTDAPPENSCKPAADVLFLSAAAFAPRVVGVILTGMGMDGTRGAAAIKGAGGRIIAQDQESSVVWGMPGAAAAAGVVEWFGSPDELGRRAAEIAGLRVAPRLR